MKQIALIAVLALALPLAATAKTAPNKAPAKSSAHAAAKKPPAKASVKAAPKKSPAKTSVDDTAKKTTDKAASSPAVSKTDSELSPEEMAIAESVQTGHIKCELGAGIDIQADRNKHGFFTLIHNNKERYYIHPVSSRTGAIRLEDGKADVVWLQLAGKSMLMSQKKGLRLADECQTAAQVQQAEAAKKNPPRSLFERAPRPVAESAPPPVAEAVPPDSVTQESDESALAPSAGDDQAPGSTQNEGDATVTTPPPGTDLPPGSAY